MESVEDAASEPAPTGARSCTVALRPSHGAIRRGWVWVEVVAHGAAKEAPLLLVAPETGARSRTLVALLPAPIGGRTVGLAWIAGEFSHLDLLLNRQGGERLQLAGSVRRLGHFEAIARVGLAWAHRTPFCPGRLRELVGESTRKWKEGGSWALKEWGRRVASGTEGLSYATWIRLFDTLEEQDRTQIHRHMNSFRARPTISVLMPAHEASARSLQESIGSLQRQLYPAWELCIAADESLSPSVHAMLQEAAAGDARIRVRTSPETATSLLNLALETARGDFVARLDPGDLLSEHALYLVAERLDRAPETDLLYTDEDYLSDTGQRVLPRFKPRWSPDLLLSTDYVGRMCVVRREFVERLGGFRPEYEGAESYDLVLRVAANTTPGRIQHVPYVLYHSTMRAASDDRSSAERRALRSHLSTLGVDAEVLPGYERHHRVRYGLPPSAPLVSLIVATRDNVELLAQVAEGILDQTDYEPIELIIVDNQSREQETTSYLREIGKRSRVRILRYDAPFNYSAMNNLGVQEASGSIVGLINNDVEVLGSDWLKEMVSHALRPEVGVVGAKLLFGDRTVQHAGVVLGLRGVAAHLHKHFPYAAEGYMARAQVTQNFSAVTAACLLMRRSVFEEVGGLDDRRLQVAYNDVDLCLRVRLAGYRILWTPHAELLHLESTSRAGDARSRARYAEEFALMRQRWSSALVDDPFYSPNLSLEVEDARLAFPPRTQRPWVQPFPAIELSLE